ncbi:DUF4268 domain-containing protein [Novosphingobium sp. FSW06-99]|uniref:DUF4268 domain-containing protein n=1 Tax=Novosphingobium sp. FSW06-99 TaxID=1739113 RepID=UPI0018D20557|nr:DUF4268 domain-containing protein [Novosphingobium sp. FSW06-99]
MELREIWTGEATDFTPWLAHEENLTVLGEALGLELELEAQEKAVGPFSADILCKDIASGTWVLVENQLERTDHKHLGQLLTYASGLEAATIVWIAKRFADEHRATLDWLNRITDETFRFFGLEVELWRIGESPAAPKFNIISKPNDWSRSMATASRVIEESGMSGIRLLQRDFWASLNDELNRQKGPVAGNRKPQPQPFMSYAIGRSSFSIGATMMRPSRQIRANLWIGGDHRNAFFGLLQEQQEAINGELGYRLIWEPLPELRDSRISVFLNDVDPEDRQDWSRQHAWLAKHVNDIYRAFFQRVRLLDAGAWGGADGEEN